MAVIFSTTTSIFVNQQPSFRRNRRRCRRCVRRMVRLLPRRGWDRARSAASTQLRLSPTTAITPMLTTQTMHCDARSHHPSVPLIAQLSPAHCPPLAMYARESDPNRAQSPAKSATPCSLPSPLTIDCVCGCRLIILVVLGAAVFIVIAYEVTYGEVGKALMFRRRRKRAAKLEEMTMVRAIRSRTLV